MTDPSTSPTLSDEDMRENVAHSLQRLRHSNHDTALTDRLIEQIHGYADKLGVNITDFGTSALEFVSFRIMAVQRHMAEVMREGVTMGLGRQRLRELEEQERQLLSVFYSLIAAKD